MKASRSAKPVLIASAAAIAVATLGALTTDLGDWYARLHKPPWQPPDWLFGPAWTLIFAMTALSGVLYWWTNPPVQQRRGVLAAFAANGFFNFLWSLLFFRMKRPDWALLEVVVLWLSIVLIMALVIGRSRASFYLLIPYLLWVSFASFLNLTIVRLNGY
jgi:tryptophan-rich sensory protein